MACQARGARDSIALSQGQQCGQQLCQYESLVRQSGLFLQIANTPKATNSNTWGKLGSDTQKRAHPYGVVQGGTLVHISTPPSVQLPYSTPQPPTPHRAENQDPLLCAASPKGQTSDLATWLRWNGAALLYPQTSLAQGEYR